MKSAVATGGSKEHSPAGEEEQDATSTIVSLHLHAHALAAGAFSWQ